jgi:hypothetical protein
LSVTALGAHRKGIHHTDTEVSEGGQRQIWNIRKTCYKVFKREVLEKITIEEDRFGFEPEITAKIAKLDVRIYEIGISYSGRTYKEGKNSDGRMVSEQFIALSNTTYFVEGYSLSYGLF